MNKQLISLLNHAGLVLEGEEGYSESSLFECICECSKDQDQVLEYEAKFAKTLAQVVAAAFESKAHALDRQYQYAFSRLGSELDDGAFHSKSLSAMRRWVLMRLILDFALDLVLAGDMDPLAQSLANELCARNVESESDFLENFWRELNAKRS